MCEGSKRKKLIRNLELGIYLLTRYFSQARENVTAKHISAIVGNSN